MLVRAVNSVVIASLLLSGPQGCSHSSKPKTKSDQASIDPAADQARLQRKLNDPRMSAQDRYKLRVKLANANTRASPLKVPDYDEYAGLVAAKPSEPDAKVAYARALAATSDRAGRLYTDPHAGEGAAWMSDVVRKSPGKAEYFLLRARCSEISGSPDGRQIGSDVAAAAKLSPDDPAVHIEEAKIAVAQRRYSAAAAHVKAVVKRSPKNAEAHYLAGVLAQIKNDPAAASAEYAAALRCQPDHVDALTVAAMNDWAAGRTGDFFAKVDRVRAVFPEHAVVHFGQAVREISAGDRLAAINDLQAAASGDRENEVYPALLSRVTAEQEQIAARQGASPSNQSNQNASSGENLIVGGAVVLVTLGLIAALCGSNDSGTSHAYVPPDYSPDGLTDQQRADRDQQNFWDRQKAEEERQKQEQEEQQQRDENQQRFADQLEAQRQAREQERINEQNGR